MSGQVGSLIAAIKRKLARFPGSSRYWEGRYASEGNSGAGSYSKLAEFKAEILNGFVRDHSIASVIEFGCGDGNQLALAEYPSYIGLDVSYTAVMKCRERFQSDSSKSFRMVSEYQGEQAELALSLDVIYHLVEDRLFVNYMTSLFDAATQHIIIYSSDTDENERGQEKHVRHRRFSRWVESHAAGWQLVQHVPNRYPYNGDWRVSSFASFFIYSKRN